jgi:hypothetical protein
MSFRPVFVVGCQRSGSTLLGAMLGSHPDMVCLPEAQFISDLMPPGPPDAPVDPAAVIDAVERHWRFQVWEWDLAGRRPAHGECPATYRGALEWLVRTYDGDTKSGASTVWVEQQPGHVRALRDLVRHFPDLKAIHIVRDGRAVAASLLPLDWGPNDILPAATFWEQRVARGYAAAAFLGPDQLMHIRYEDIVRDPEAAMRRCADFIGVDFEPAMVNSTGLRLPRFTEHQHNLVGSMPNPKRIDAWRGKLKPREIEIFEATCGDLLRYLGYETAAAQPRPVSLLEKLAQVGRDQFKKGVNHYRFKARTRTFEEGARRAAERPAEAPAAPDPLHGIPTTGRAELDAAH